MEDVIFENVRRSGKMLSWSLKPARKSIDKYLEERRFEDGREEFTDYNVLYIDYIIVKGPGWAFVLNNL